MQWSRAYQDEIENWRKDQCIKKCNQIAERKYGNETKAFDLRVTAEAGQVEDVQITSEIREQAARKVQELDKREEYIQSIWSASSKQIELEAALETIGTIVSASPDW